MIVYARCDVSFNASRTTCAARAPLRESEFQKMRKRPRGKTRRGSSPFRAEEVEIVGGKSVPRTRIFQTRIRINFCFCRSRDRDRRYDTALRKATSPLYSYIFSSSNWVTRDTWLLKWLFSHIKSCKYLAISPFLYPTRKGSCIDLRYKSRISTPFETSEHRQSQSQKSNLFRCNNFAQCTHAIGTEDQIIFIRGCTMRRYMKVSTVARAMQVYLPIATENITLRASIWTSTKCFHLISTQISLIYLPNKKRAYITRC